MSVYRSTLALSLLGAAMGCQDAGSSAATGPELARAPEAVRFEENYDYVRSCNGFNIERVGTYRVIGRDYYAADGSYDHSIIQFLYNPATVTNLATGETLSDKAAFMLRYDGPTNTWTINGNVYDVTRPGHGRVLYDVGHSIFVGDLPDHTTVTSAAGKHDLFEQDASTPFYCGLFAN